VKEKELRIKKGNGKVRLKHKVTGGNYMQVQRQELINRVWGQSTVRRWS
jgi:hypothetical protein